MSEREREREQRREMREVNLTKVFRCGYTPTPKQTSVSKSHKSPHISSSVWGTFTHSLTPYIFSWHVSSMFDECLHTFHWSRVGSFLKGCLRGRRKCLKQMKMKEFFLLFPSLSLSLSLINYFPILSLHFLHFSALPHSLNTCRGRQWKKLLPTEKVCQTSNVFMMRHRKW